MVAGGLRVGGGVVFWSLGQWTSLASLADGLGDLGLGPCVPERRPPLAALRDALELTFAGGKHLVRPLEGREGFAVVEESRDKEHNSYRQVLSARLEEVGGQTRLLYHPLGDACEAITARYNLHLGLLRAAQVSRCLVRVLGTLHGTALRPEGSVYWLPEESLAAWAPVARVLEGAAHGRPHACYVLRHLMDHDAVRAVRDAVVAEVGGAARALHAEVMAGTLGERALEHRRGLAQDLHAKIGLYEGLLGVGLEQVRASLGLAEEALGAAALLLAAGGGEGGAP